MFFWIECGYWTYYWYWYSVMHWIDTTRKYHIFMCDGFSTNTIWNQPPFWLGFDLPIRVSNNKLTITTAWYYVIVHLPDVRFGNRTVRADPGLVSMVESEDWTQDAGGGGCANQESGMTGPLQYYYSCSTKLSTLLHCIPFYLLLHLYYCAIPL